LLRCGEDVEGEFGALDDLDTKPDWAAELRAFRHRNALKQEATASLLGVSQAYISRVENGTVTPSPALIQRLTILSRQPDHRPVIDLVKAAIRHSPALCCLYLREGEEVFIEEHSRAFYGAGHPFDQHRRGGKMRWEIIGDEARSAICALTRAGAFEGRIGYMEVVWSTPPCEAKPLRHFRSGFTPIRGDDGLWRLQSSILEISPKQKQAARQTWGGPVRFFDYDEEPPYAWP